MLLQHLLSIPQIKTYNFLKIQIRFIIYIYYYILYLLLLSENTNMLMSLCKLSRTFAYFAVTVPPGVKYCNPSFSNICLPFKKRDYVWRQAE